MKKCSVCGTSLKDDAKFCPKCGEKQRQEAAGEPRGAEKQEGPRKADQPQGQGQTREAAQPQGQGQTREAAQLQGQGQTREAAQLQGQGQTREAAQPQGQGQLREAAQLRQPAQPAQDRQPEAPKKKSLVPFVAICVALILAMGGGTAFYLWKLNKTDSGQEALAAKEGDETEEETEEPETSAESAEATEATEDATLPAEAPTTAATQPATTPAVPETAAMPTAPPTAPSVPETAASIPADYTTLYVVNCDEFITLRSSASTSASELARIPLGSVVSYVSPAENGFYKVVYNGKTGYALASYLSSDPYYYEGPETADYPTMYVVNCEEFITMRTSDSTSASEITKIPLGSAVSYVSTAGNGFYKIIYNGNTGYALASYLSY